MERFIEVFGINWKLLIAQLINFAILVFILGKFVYKPIIRALDNRTKKIEEGVQFADKAKKELAGVEVLKTEELKKAELEGQKIVKQAEVSAAKVSDNIVSGAEKEKERILATGKNILLEQKAQMQKNFYQEASGVVKDALTKVLMKSKFDKEEEALISETVKEINVK